MVFLDLVTLILMKFLVKLYSIVKVYYFIDLPMENLEHSMYVLLEILKKCVL